MNDYIILMTSLTILWALPVTWVSSDVIDPREVKLGLVVSKEGMRYLPAVQNVIDDINLNMNSSVGTRFLLTHRSVTSMDLYTLSMEVCSLLEDGAAAILTLSSCQVTSQLNQLPVLTDVTVVDLHGSECDVITNTNTPFESEAVPKAVLDIMVEEQWDDVQMFYEAEYEEQIIWLVDQLSQYGRQSSIFTISVGNATSMISLKDTFQLYNYFFVLASHKGTAWMLTKARLSDLDLLGPKYQWLVVDGDRQLQKDSLLSLLLEGDNIAIVEPDKRESEVLNETLNTTMQWLAEGVRGVIEAGQWSDDLHTCAQAGLNHSQTRNSLYRSLQGSTPTRSEPRIAVLTLTGLPQKLLNWSLVGSWTATSGFALDGYLFPDVHRGFNNRTFLITTVSYPPFIVKLPNGSYDGICFDILHELQRVMNFSYRVIEPPDGQWGVRLPDGNFSGMFGLIQRKVVDFGVGIFGVTAERQQAVDYTTPFLADPTIVLMKKPNLASSQVFICLGPFQYSVWLLIALSVLVVGATLWFMVWNHPLHDKQRKVDLRTVGIYNPSINIWQTFGAFMQQGMVYVPESHSARLLVASWWFYVIVVVGTYNGNLIAFLTAPKVYTPVNSLNELAKSGMKFGFMRGSYVHGVFESANHGIYRQLWKGIEKDKDEYLVDHNLKGMAKALQDNNYAFLLEKSFYDTLANKNVSFQNRSCDFARARESFMTTFYAFPFQKHSPYTNMFSQGLQRILEAGLVQRWQRQWYAVAHRCTGLERTTEQNNISLAEAQGAFYILGIGLLVATIFLFGEKAVCRGIFKSKSNHASENKHSDVTNGSVFHVGTLPPVVPTVTTVTSLPLQERSNQRTREINQQYPIQTFSPYAKWKKKKVRKSRSFPLLFKSCCRKTKRPSDEGPAWELPTSKNDAHSNGDQKGVQALFSYGPPTAWYDQFGRTTHTAINNGTLGRRWHSDTETYSNGNLVKDAETGEFQKAKDKREAKNKL